LGVGGQSAITSLLEVMPEPDERSARTDFYGNTVVEVAFHAPHAEVEFRLRARVERTAPQETDDRSPSLEQLAGALAEVRSLEGDSPHHFLANSPRVRAQKVFREYALEQIDTAAMTTLQIVETIGRAIDRDMTFEPGSTQVDTPPGRSVCPATWRMSGLHAHHDRLPARHRCAGRLCERVPAHHSA
jgi:transglutaminase-like putative cysteine protease